MKRYRWLFVGIPASLVLLVLLYGLSRSYVIDQAEKRLRDTMLECRAFHLYVQRDLHPAYLKLMQQQRLPKGFFAPELLSSSYIARTFQKYYNEERARSGIPQVHYKMASTDPRNPLNQAGPYEIELIKWFNQDKSRTHYDEIVKENGKKYLLYARPFLVTEKHCLRCHGEEKDAPEQLRKIYQWAGGWDRQVGEIPAIEILRSPIDGEFNGATLLFAGFTIVFVGLMGLVCFNSRLRSLVNNRTLNLKKSEKRLEHLNRVLNAIRNVNLLIIHEKDKARLLNQACRLLVETNGLHNAWIVLLKDGKPVGPYYYAGFEGAFAAIAERLKSGKIPYCVEKSLESKDLVVISDPENQCDDCPLVYHHNERVGFSIGLRYAEHLYGWLSVSAPVEYADEIRELKLFEQTASDIAFALYSIDLEEQHQKSLKAVEESEAKYRSYIENSSNAIFVVNEKGNYIDVNNAACQMLGYFREEILAMSIADLRYGKSSENTKSTFSTLKEKGKTSTRMILKSKSGDKVYVDFNGVVLGDNRFMAICNDVTFRTIAEQKLKISEERNRVLLEHAGMGIGYYDLQGNCLLMNQKACEYMEAGPDDVLGKNMIELFGEQGSKLYLERIKQTVKSDVPLIFEDNLDLPFADSVWFHSTYTKIKDAASNVTGVQIISTDITERVQNEKINEAQLEIIEYAAGHSESDLLQKVLDIAEEITTSNIGFFHYVHDDQKSISLQAWSTNTKLNMCKATAQLAHYPISEAGVWVECVQKQGPVIHNDYEALEYKKGMPEGHAPVVRELVVPVIREGKIKAILGIGNKTYDYNDKDVAKVQKLADVAWETIVRKQAEEAYKTLVQDSLQGLIIVQNGKVVFANSLASEISGFSIDEMVAMQLEDIVSNVHDDDKELVRTKLGSLITSKEKFHQQQLRLINKSGNMVWLDVFAISIEYNGQPAIQIAYLDITDRKLAEAEALKSSVIIDSTSDPVVCTDVLGNITMWNHGAEQVYGYKANEVMGKSIKFLYKEEDRGVLQNMVSELVSGKDIPDIEVTCIDKNGNDVQIILSLMTLKDESGKVTELVGITKDITDRKKAEKALKENEEKYRSLFNNINVGVALHEIIVDENNEPIDFVFLDANPKYEELTKLKLKDIYGKLGSEVLPNIEPKWMQLYGNVAVTGESIEIEDYSVYLNKYWNVKAYSPAQNQFAVALSDITEQKKAEAELAKNEMMLETSQSLSKVGGWEWHVKDQSMFWTTETYRIHDIDPDDVEYGSSIHLEKSMKCYMPEDRPVIMNAFERCVSHGEPYDLEFQFRSMKGRQLRIRTMAKPVFENGKIVKLVGTMMDVTEKHRMEQKYQTLFQKMIDGFALHEIICNDDGVPVDYRFLEINPSFEKLTGLTREIIGKTVLESMPQTEKYWIDIYGNVALTGKPITFENYASELEKYFKVTAYRPAPNQFACLFADITERKMAEKALQSTEAKQRAMITNISDVICIVDKEGIIKYNSPNIEKHFGWAPEDLTGDDAWHTVHPDDLDRIQQQFYKILRVENDTRTHVYRYKCKNGSYKWIELTASNQIDNIDIQGVLMNFHDVSDRIKAEEIQQIFNIRWMQAQKIAHIGHWEYNFVTQTIWGSEEAFNIFGFQFDLEQNPGQTLLVEDIEACIPDRQRVHQALLDLLEKNERYEIEYDVIRADNGNRITLYSRADILLDKDGSPMLVLGTIQDITERKRVEEQIQKDLKEKEVLLKEIHHRVKNNMQVIISLLNLQADKVKDKRISSLFEDSRKRIYSMALVHEQLYKSEYLSKIEMKTYIESISKDLIYSYSPDHKIDLVLNVRDVMCDISQAIPCGLLFNELITNSLKHAFQGVKRRQMQISFSKVGANFHIAVKDNGVGIPENVDLERADSLGLKLISILTNQLEGNLTIKNGTGTEFNIVFPAIEV